MNLRRPKPNLPLLLFAMGAVVLHAAAQNSGQSIIFSSPPSDNSQSDTPSLAAPSSHLPSLPSTLQGSSSFFNFSTPNYGPALPRPQAGAAEQQRMKKLLDGRKDWTQMTPAEMFGVSPAEKTPGTPGKEAAGQDKNQTPMDRYFDQGKKSHAGGLGDWRNDPANPPGSAGDGAANAGQNVNGIPGSRLNSFFSANQNAAPNWDSFSTPPAQAVVKPDIEKLAAMQRFRDMLAPSPAPAGGASAAGQFPLVPKIEVNPNMTQPAFVPNLAGASFTPLSDAIGRPVGLTPLPGIVAPVLQPVAAPSWVPQPAPWLSQTPPPFTIPQRKF
jgi:hypothetical protein